MSKLPEWRAEFLRSEAVSSPRSSCAQHSTGLTRVCFTSVSKNLLPFLSSRGSCFLFLSKHCPQTHFQQTDIPVGPAQSVTPTPQGLSTVRWGSGWTEAQKSGFNPLLCCSPATLLRASPSLSWVSASPSPGDL